MTRAMPAPGTAPAAHIDPAPPVNPFPGPKAYQRGDQGYFFGRTDEIEELTSLVLSSSATLLYAPSGTGKSSLLQAGVAPYLESRFKFRVLSTVRLEASVRGGSSEERANRFVQTVCDTISDGDESNRGDIAAAARSRRRHDTERVLLILDQFEEVFDDPDLWEERHDFFLALTAALEENTWLRAIIALRSDYLASLVPYERSLPANLVVRYQLADMVQAQAEEVIGAAFARSGLALGDANLRVVADTLYENAAVSGHGPAQLQHASTIQLQIVCRTLWDELHENYGEGPVPDGVLSERSINLRNSMVQFVDEAIRDVMQRSRGGEAAVRWWLGHELITPHGRRAFVFVDETATAGLPSSVIEALEHVRLIQLEQRRGSRLAELTHDSMIDGVRASNEAWLRTAYRQRRRAWVSLLFVLIALLAAFGSLRANLSGIVAGPLVGKLGGTSQLSFSGQSGQAITVNGTVYAHAHAASVKVVEIQPGAGERVVAMQALPAGKGTTTIAIAAPTVPGRVYAARLVGQGDETTGFTMTVFDRPTVPHEQADTLVAPDAPGVGVLLDAEPSGDQPGGVLISVDGTNLRAVTGARVAVFNGAQNWAVVDRSQESGVAVLEFNPVSSAADQKPVSVHQASVDPPTRLGIRDSRTVNVDPLQRISVDAGIGEAGVELTCDGNNAVRVAPVDPTNRRVDSPPINIGSAGIVLPLSGDKRPSELVLYSPDGPATCQAGVKRYGAESISTGGQRVLAVPQDVKAVAHPIDLGADSAVIVGDQAGIRPSLTCESSTFELAESSGRRVAVVPAHSSCELWLVRSGESTDPISVSVWVSDVAERQGG